MSTIDEQNLQTQSDQKSVGKQIGGFFNEIFALPIDILDRVLGPIPWWIVPIFIGFTGAVVLALFLDLGGGAAVGAIQRIGQ